jgi:hypothetical protein
MRYAEGLHGRPAIERLYGTIRAGISRHGFQLGEVRTTCGSEEEGVWTWINLNDVLYHAFDGEHEPVGIVEVGGSSLQLTFPTDEDPDAVAHVHRVELAGRRFAVSCRSFLGLFPACSAAYGDIVQDRLATAGIPDLTHACGDFVGIDGVYYATEPWRIAHEPERLAELIPDRCHTVANFPHIDERELVQAQAANATYIQALLARLFRDSGRRLVRAVPTRQDGETLLTWTRGYLIHRHSGPRSGS